MNDPPPEPNGGRGPRIRVNPAELGRRVAVMKSWCRSYELFLFVTDTNKLEHLTLQAFSGY